MGDGGSLGFIYNKRLPPDVSPYHALARDPHPSVSAGHHTPPKIKPNDANDANGANKPSVATINQCLSVPTAAGLLPQLTSFGCWIAVS